MGNFIDLTGMRFGRLVVINRAKNTKDRKSQWLCRCDCGNETIVCGRYLRSGATKSCGCYHSERTHEVGIRNKIHGFSHTRLYRIWNGILRRCNNPKSKRYSDYGGRGITVCEEWASDFMCFRSWALKNGYCDDLSLDRKDNDGPYSPENCRWATDYVQANNARSNRLITYKGKTQTMKQWADEYGLNYATLLSRLDRNHWPIEKALLTPARKIKQHSID